MQEEQEAGRRRLELLLRRRSLMWRRGWNDLLRVRDDESRLVFHLLAFFFFLFTTRYDLLSCSYYRIDLLALFPFPSILFCHHQTGLRGRASERVQSPSMNASALGIGRRRFPSTCRHAAPSSFGLPLVSLSADRSSCSHMVTIVLLFSPSPPSSLNHQTWFDA